MKSKKDNFDTVIQHEDGSGAIHTKDGAWIDYAAPGPSQLDRLSADVTATKAWREAWRKTHPAPWYSPIIGALILIAVIAALVAIYSIASMAVFKLCQS